MVGTLRASFGEARRVPSGRGATAGTDGWSSGRLEVWAPVAGASDHLIEYLVGPAGPQEAGLRESDQQSSKADGVEDVWRR